MPEKRRQKGTGALFQRADGCWLGQVTYYDGEGKRRLKTVSGRNQPAVKRRLAALVKQLDETGALPMGQQNVKTWTTYWLERIAAPRLRPRTLSTYRSHVDQYIVPAIGRIRLDRLGPQHVRTVHSFILDKGLSSTTAQHAHVTLTKCLTDAVREGLIPRNPAALVDGPRRAVVNEAYLTNPQAIELLLSLEKDPLVSRWAMALFTGQRQGECLGLEIDRVMDDRLDISWQLQRLPYSHGCDPACGRKRGGNCPQRVQKFNPDFEYREAAPGLYLTRPKTKASIKVIPLVDPFRTILLQAIGDRTEGLVWTREDGRPIEPADDNQEWHNALDAAGLPSVKLHSARHTAATLLLEAGVDPKVIQQILGQTSLVTMRGYQHVSLALATDAMKALGAALSGAGSPSA